MVKFRLFLAAWFLVILGYTIAVTVQHGPDLLPVFFGNIAGLDWSGQFNVDFSSFLALSALWLVWRHHFSATGLVLAVLGFFGGGLFLMAYLTIVSGQVRGDIAALLLGRARAAAR